MNFECYMVSVVGMKYRDAKDEILTQLNSDTRVWKLEPEPTNMYSKNAIKCILNGVHVGYIAESDIRAMFIDDFNILEVREITDYIKGRNLFEALPTSVNILLRR